ncbi:MAG: diaminopimelate epimerase, partial [Clostridia bacterium]|nr:diaminopimelate epimerase [Clostridia bacterium]
VFNSDGSDGGLAANPIRCAAKYLYDNKLTEGEEVAIECCGTVRTLTVSSFNGVARSVAVNLGKPECEKLGKERLNYDCQNPTIVKIGNEHCVVFVDNTDKVDMEEMWQSLANDGIIEQNCFLECVRLVNNVTLKMRVYEKINGETYSCGSAAAAAAIAAIENGACLSGETITVKLKGGDLFVILKNNGEVELDGSVKESFKGIIEI